MLGMQGEQAAAAYLKAHGYELLEQNYRLRTGEIDIIAKKKDRISFIEVKTRCDNRCGLPSEAVNLPKQKKIIGTAYCYMQSKHLADISCSFDVIEVYPKNGEKWEIRHLKDAFET